MSGLNNIPVIDLFAGPGGLGEGFSSIYYRNKRVFDIKLSIEKDENAQSTLELRSFFRQFNKGKVPDEYYKVLEEPDSEKRTRLKQSLFDKYPKEYQAAKSEAWLAELGAEEFPPELIDKKIKKGLEKRKNWVLIGGPPCQAYSLVGRSRVGGIDQEDHRVYLYKEYLRIIAVHHPSVFVMENVKGLLSAKINGEKVFNCILRDLKNPSLVFKNIDSPKYRIYSLTTEAEISNLYNEPFYNEDRDYLIESDKYGIPQKRHRVILLGIRENIETIPDLLKIQLPLVKLKDVIGDLPKIRSGLNRSFVSSEIVNGKKKRYYKNETDSDINWQTLMNTFRIEIISWNGFAKNYSDQDVKIPAKGIGSEFIKYKTPSVNNPLFKWYNDPKLKGVCNHESRSHLIQDLKRYMFSSMFTKTFKRFPRLHEYDKHSTELLPDHENAESGKFTDRFRVQLPNQPATTVTSHISKDGHYFIHYDPDQCRSLTVREAARIQTFPDNYLFCGSRTAQYHQVGNAVPPFLAKQIAKIVFKLISKKK
ncbi:MAG: DNA cytosine methyltransferase [Bacteroidetes bacterium]|nr:DNA cytosine methyltransferase [Bacteroidota bacterium]